MRRAAKKGDQPSPLQLKNLFCELRVLCGQWFDFELSSYVNLCRLRLTNPRKICLLIPSL